VVVHTIIHISNSGGTVTLSLLELVHEGHEGFVGSEHTQHILTRKVANGGRLDDDKPRIIPSIANMHVFFLL
jgi:hypothetical protein